MHKSECRLQQENALQQAADTIRTQQAYLQKLQRDFDDAFKVQSNSLTVLDMHIVSIEALLKVYPLRF